MSANTAYLDCYEVMSFNDIILPNILARHCPLDNGRHTLTVNYNTAPNLSALDCLPIELQQQIVLDLDLASLLVFRRVNKRAMDLVASLIKWKHITKHATNALRLSIGLGTHHTFPPPPPPPQILNALCEDTCNTPCPYSQLAMCTRPAKFLDMTTLARVCEPCFKLPSSRRRLTRQMDRARRDLSRQLNKFRKYSTHTWSLEDEERDKEEREKGDKVAVNEDASCVEIGVFSINIALNALRMAITIGEQHKFTIAELFTTLCSRTCADCGTPTHYLDVLICKRSMNCWPDQFLVEQLTSAQSARYPSLQALSAFQRRT
ncbi:hypothetical protein EJ02DRAFT_433709 [Clathrospora elynae]|uniref:F-box domain-containing protein n=1 Tax=Clathrospora elynae TaxID=706981 RepID=A0A6A5SWD4_9PLEO|nr:hypothetical protein EJ02DRAFT_433709 [Clathrospora elynae]